VAIDIALERGNESTSIKARTIPLLTEEGWMRGQEIIAKLPYSAQTGWSLTSHVGSVSHAETSLVSDHPVRSIKGSFVPVGEEGNGPRFDIRRFIHPLMVTL
jgi:hypothetical protein